MLHLTAGQSEADLEIETAEPIAWWQKQFWEDHPPSRAQIRDVRGRVYFVNLRGYSWIELIPLDME